MGDKPSLFNIESKLKVVIWYINFHGKHLINIITYSPTRLQPYALPFLQTFVRVYFPAKEDSMALRWGGFTGRITGRSFEDILTIGKHIDSDLAYVRRSLPQLTKNEKRALMAYRGIEAKRCDK